MSTGQDSDADSHSVCSGSDTHSGHTSLSGVTEKASITATTTGHTSTLDVINPAFITTSTSPGKLLYFFTM